MSKIIYHKGDIVKIKSRLWYAKHKDKEGCVQVKHIFTQKMKRFLGKQYLIIEKADNDSFILKGCKNYTFGTAMFAKRIKRSNHYKCTHRKNPFCSWVSSLLYGK